MTKLLGIKVGYQYPLDSKYYNLNGELIAQYSESRDIFCIFNDHLDQKTAKMLGWDFQLDQQAQIITVAYDLENLQIGCLFNIPEGLDSQKRRLYRVVEMSTIQVYPASVTCKLVQEYETRMSMTDVTNFETSNFNLLKEEN